MIDHVMSDPSAMLVVFAAFMAGGVTGVLVTLIGVSTADAREDGDN